MSMRGTSSSCLEKTTKGYRTGYHATVYDIKRDPKLKDKNVIRDKKNYHFPFISGSTYKGEWKDDVRNGFGTAVSQDGTKYEGDWLNNKRHGRGTLWVKVDNRSIQRYVGEWVCDRMEGEGTYHYDNDDTYDGYWVDGKRCGRGRHTFTNGDKYDGEYQDDVRCGNGTMYYVNKDIYSGNWVDDMKHGPGYFFYWSTKNVYVGEWKMGQPRCGEYRKVTEEELGLFNQGSRLKTAQPLGPGEKEGFDLPELMLADPSAVLQDSMN